MSAEDMADPNTDQSLAEADRKAALRAIDDILPVVRAANETGKDFSVVIVDEETGQPISDERKAELTRKADEATILNDLSGRS